MNDRHGPSDQALPAWAFRWGADEDRRPGLPWIGVFLVVFGALLLVERMLPDQRLGDVAVLAAGLASLLVWVLRRSTVALYAGAFLTALALPGTIQALGQPLGPGWGTLFFGLAFLLVAAVRASQGRKYQENASEGRALQTQPGPCGPQMRCSCCKAVCFALRGAVAARRLLSASRLLGWEEADVLPELRFPPGADSRETMRCVGDCGLIHLQSTRSAGCAS